MRPVDLGWMRVFAEVAAAGSLSEAARRLHLTQPAVSHHIRRAEAEFGVALLRRVHRGTELTEAGRALEEILAPTVARLDTLAARLRQGGGPTALKLYTDYAFSSLWLIPRIHRFRAAHPEIDLQVIATQQVAPRDLRPGDTGVLFGTAAAIGVPCEMVLAESVVPVCTPAFAAAFAAAGGGAGGGRADLLAEAPLIHLDSPQSPAPWFDWPAYLRARGRDGAAARGGLQFNTYSLVIEATLAGQGVALGWRGLIDSLLARGILIEAGPPLANPGRGYFLVQPGGQTGALTPEAAQLRAFLLAESAGAQAPPGP